MRPFTVETAPTAEAATAMAGQYSDYIAGGTTLLDLMKLDVMQPATLIDLNAIPGHAGVEITQNAVHFGAMATMAEAAANQELRAQYPVLAESLLLAASQQLRNMARLGGNVLQRTRCAYFRDARESACNKRNPGSGCAAITGNSRAHAILGTSPHCIATYPGDWGAALAALDADVDILGKQGARSMKFAALHRLPEDTPDRETNLAPGDLITGFTVQGPWPRSRYVKIRDRSSYEFALASAAVALKMEGDKITEARIGLGGVATIPWRAKAAETALQGRTLNETTASEAAEIAFADARTTPDNAYKLALGKATLIRALLEAGA